MNLLIFLGLLSGGGLLTLLNAGEATALEQENRMQEPFPDWDVSAVTEGSFFPAVERWFDDRFPLRANWIALSRDLTQWRGLPSNGGPELVSRNMGDQYGNIGTAQIEPETDPEPEDLPPPYPTGRPLTDDEILRFGLELGDDFSDGIRDSETRENPDPAEDVPPVEGSIVNDFLVMDNRGYEIVGYSPASLEYYAGQITHFMDAAGEGIRYYASLVPSAIAFLEQEKYRALSADQEAALEHFDEVLDDRITVIDTYGALDPHRREYIHFHTDHHWTGRGAFYVYEKFAQAAGVNSLPLELLDYATVEGFRGSLYRATLHESLDENRDTVEVYMVPEETDYVYFYDDRPFLDGETYNFDLAAASTNKYGVFIGGDDPRSIMTNDRLRERKILVLKDSYANAFIPYLSAHYSEVHIIDPRSWDGNVVDYLHEHAIHEVLFFNYFVVVSYARGYARNLGRVIDY